MYSPNVPYDVDPSSTNNFLTYENIGDCSFLSVYNANGDFVKVDSFNRNNVNAYYNVTDFSIDSNAKITMFGYLYGTVDIDPTTTGVKNLQSTRFSGKSVIDLAIVEWSSYFNNTANRNAATETKALDNFVLYPNPVTDVLSIKSDLQNAKYVVTNATGHTISSDALGDAIDVSKYVAGIYFLQITEENGTVTTKKFVKK
jgi:hypothetical protein